MQQAYLLHDNKSEAGINVSLLLYRKKLKKKIVEKLQQRGGAPIRTRNLRITKTVYG
jgi:hypothetical protein